MAALISILLVMPKGDAMSSTGFSIGTTWATRICKEKKLYQSDPGTPSYQGLTPGPAATAIAARTNTRTGMRLCQQRQLQGRRNRKQQPRQQHRTTVAKCASWRQVLASHWCRADIEHVDKYTRRRNDDKKTSRN